jgi:hypothetical protein
MLLPFGFDTALTAVGLVIALLAVGGPISRIGSDRPGPADATGSSGSSAARHPRVSLHRHRHGHRHTP